MSTSVSPANRVPIFGRRRVCGAAAAALLSALLLAPSAARSAENLLVPGADFSQLALEKGAWCRYVVVDEALGQADSTEVYVGVPSAERTAKGPAFWLEIATRPLGAGGEEAQVLKLLVLESIAGLSEGDSLGDFVLRLYIRKGGRPAEERDPATFKDLSLVVPTAESSWETSEGVMVEAPAGRFTTKKRTRTALEEQEVPTGKVRLIKKSRDDFTVWFSDEVPVFRLVKCVVERWRETETVPRIAGIPVSGRKYSKTTAELAGFGLDAEPVLIIDSPKR